MSLYVCYVVLVYLSFRPDSRLPFSINFLLEIKAHTKSIYVNELTKWFVFEAVQ